MASTEIATDAVNTQLIQPQQEDETELDLVELLYRLLEKSVYIILAALVGAVIAAVYTFFYVTPTYKSTAKLYVLNTSNAVVDLAAINIGTQLAADYKEVFSNWHVHERVIEKLNLPYSYSQLNRMVSVSNTDATRILAITVTSTSAEEARLMAQTYAEVAQEFIAETMSTQRPNIFEEARKPSAPSSPNKTRNIILGFLAGGFIAAAVVVIQFLTDDRIHGEDDVTKYTGLPVLGMMPKLKNGRTAPSKRNPQSAAGGKQA